MRDDHTLGGVVVAATLRARGKVVLLCLVVAAGKSHGRIYSSNPPPPLSQAGRQHLVALSSLFGLLQRTAFSRPPATFHHPGLQA